MRVRYAVRLMQRIPALTVREIEAASGASKILIAPASVTMIGQGRLSFENQRCPLKSYTRDTITLVSNTRRTWRCTRL